ncbi:MAG: hypothetical protein IPO92_12675 [Saprospiraceae bacterium]|nr:hypothetical protein [Saprospiraceae bacterium]
MNFNKGFFWIVLVSMVLISCKKEEKTGDLNLRFSLKYGNMPLEMFKNYTYPTSGELLQFTRLSFFISNITIRSKDGDVNLKVLDYLDLTNAHTGPNIAPNGFEYVIKGVLPRTYTSLDFGIGVPKEMNAKQPKDYKSSDILSSTAEYWSGWKSYIFFRPEGNVVINGEQVGFALHLGSDSAYRTINIPKTITIAENGITNVDIVIDMEKFFNGNSYFDINDTQQIHAQSQNLLVIKLADNLTTAIK